MSHITIKGEIGTDKTVNKDGLKCSVADLISEIRNMDSQEPIDLEIDSLGGSLLYGMELYRTLKNHEGQVNAFVDGCACSAASLIVCGADHITVRADSLIMIHGVQIAEQVVNSKNLPKLSSDIESLDSVLAEIYALRTGADFEQVREWMNSEKYMSGKEAIALGFADDLVEENPSQPNESDETFKNYKAIAKPLTEKEMEELMKNNDIQSAVKKLMNSAEASCDPDKQNTCDESKENECDPDKKKNEVTEENDPKQESSDDENETKKMDDPDGTNDPDNADDQDEPEKMQNLKNAVDEAILAERKRLQEIDALAGAVDQKLLNEAKYGAKAMTAQELAFETLKQAKAQNANFLRNWASDVEESGTNKVGVVPTSAESDQKAKYQANADLLKASVKRINEKGV